VEQKRAQEVYETGEQVHVWSRKELRKFMRQVSRCVEQTRGQEVYETGEQVCREDESSGSL